MPIEQSAVDSVVDIESRRTELATAFQAFLPGYSVLVHEEELRPYECDGLSAYRQMPLMVVLPETVEQVQRVLRICCTQDVPLVCRGAGTSLSGGALPRSDGVLLSLAKLNRILGYIMRLIRLLRLLAPLVAMWPKMPGVFIVLSMGSRCIMFYK